MSQLSPEVQILLERQKAIRAIGTMFGFEESKHPRADDGKFAKGSGGGGSKPKEEEMYDESPNEPSKRMNVPDEIPEEPSIHKHRKTKDEMAKVSGAKIAKDRADLPDGSVWKWNERANGWTMWYGPDPKPGVMPRKETRGPMEGESIDDWMERRKPRADESVDQFIERRKSWDRPGGDDTDDIPSLSIPDVPQKDVPAPDPVNPAPSTPEDDAELKNLKLPKKGVIPKLEPTKGDKRDVVKAYKSAPITAKDLMDMPKRGNAEQAELLANRIPGSIVNHSKSTESSYVRIPGGGEIRFSSHTKYGMNIPTHLTRWGNAQKRASDIDRAVRAAISGSRSYSQVPTWEKIEEDNR